MKTSIIFSFVYILAYGLMLYLNNALIFAMVLGWPFVMLWVVYAILKDKHQPTKNFEEYFYQDEEFKRLN